MTRPPRPVPLVASSPADRGLPGRIARLRAEIRAESAQRINRRIAAASTGSAAAALSSLSGDWPTRRLALVAKAEEPPPRPATGDREPCFKCGVRGDIGCEHQPWGSWA